MTDGVRTHQRQDFGYSRTVSYVNRNHWSVITQKWGSVNRKVMPFCFANVAVSIILIVLLEFGMDWTISEFGHEFMSVLVAFLVINKLSFTLGLYYELQGYLSKMNQSAIELTQLACSFTSGYTEEAYKQWRFDVTLQTLTLLRATVFVIYKGGEENVWEIPELRNNPPELFVEENMSVLTLGTSIFLPTTEDGHQRRTTKVPKELYVWGYHLKSDKNLRVPIRIAQRLRETILQHTKLLPTDPLDTIREQALLACVQEFMNSYHGIRKYLTTTGGRIFVMFYVFTLPFALLSPELNLQYPQLVVLIFIMTYGFMGIELLFVEIDDPFAEDPNELPLTEESRAAGEDICLNLMHVDGKEPVQKLISHFAHTNNIRNADHHDANGPCHQRNMNQIGRETDRLVLI
jgi:hypothetical protein